MKIKVLFYFILLVVCRISAQDIHFTQFHTTPLIMSPSFTGFMNGDFRFAANYRYQWPWAIKNANVNLNYHTQAAHADFKISGKRWKRDWFGIGASFLNDKAGDGRLSYLRGGLNLAFHKGFDDDGNFILSAGFGVEYINRSVDFEKFYFNNQWVDEVGFNTSLNASEPFKNERFHMLDMKAGMQFSFNLFNAWKTTLSYNLLHINRPKHSFYEANERLGIRQLLILQSGWQITRTFSATVLGYYTYQKKASTFLVGCIFQYNTFKRNNKDRFAFFAGVLYRNKDAVSPLLGLEVARIRLGVSYDVNLSGLKPSSLGNGGLEVSLSYTGLYKRASGKKNSCPEVF